MSHSELVILPRQRDGDRVTLAAELRSGSHTQRRWFSVPAEREADLTDAADPFVLGLMYSIMARGEPVRVRGRVSPSLLANLEEYMAAWRMWRPDLFRIVPIDADDASEADASGRVSDEAVALFSGGVDACYTVWRHTRGEMGFRRRNITAAVFAQGFDIALDADVMYAEAFARNERLMRSIGVELIPVRSNHGADAWFTLLPAELAGCLALFGGRFRDGLMAASDRYAQPNYGDHLNVITDNLLTGEGLRLRVDGAETTRADKCAAIAAWPEAMRELRVCLIGNTGRLNCGRCEKCVRTWLCFRAAGVDPPDIFEHTPDRRDIRSTRLTRLIHLVEWEDLLEVAERNGYDREPWARAARAHIAATWRRFRRWGIRAKLRAWAARRGWCSPSSTHSTVAFRHRFH